MCAVLGVDCCMSTTTSSHPENRHRLPPKAIHCSILGKAQIQLDDCLPCTSASKREKKRQKCEKKRTFKSCFFLWISTDLKTKERRAGLKSCFGSLLGQIGKNQLFGVIRRDIGFGSPNCDRPDEIGMVGMYGLIPKLLGIEKEIVHEVAQVIHITRENLQIAKHKSMWWAEWTPCWFVLCNLQIFSSNVYYRKRGSASYIVREVRSVREREIQREREREREWDESDVTLVALKLAMNFAPFLAKNLHLSIGEEFCTFPYQKFAP